MSYSCLIGSSKFDAVNFVRQKIGDTNPAAFVISDNAFSSYVPTVAQDLSRFIPMETTVGSVYANTSPLLTVAGQQRYLCNAANGFTYPILDLQVVLYRASGGFSAASEIGYMALLPFSPANAFLFTPSLVDSPSMRLLRDQYLNEIDHYGVGQARMGIDPSGTPFIDLFPAPNTTGLPVYVDYTTYHQVAPVVGDPDSSVTIATIPDRAARHFAKLLQAEIFENEGYTLAQAVQAQAGMLKVVGSPDWIERKARTLREEVYNELGVGSGVAEVSA